MSNQELLALHRNVMLLLIRTGARPVAVYLAATNAAHYARLVADEKA